MDNNIHINPESIGKFMAISDEPSPEGYESPITGYINQFSHQIIEQRDNAIVARIGEQIEMDVNKNELIRALNYDRNQFNEGYKKGYRDAQKKYEETDKWNVIHTKEDLPKERDWYLGLFKEPDTDFIGLPYICDYVGEVTKGTTNEGWILSHCTDVDNVIDYFRNLICVAWRPLPESCKAVNAGFIIKYKSEFYDKGGAE